MDTSNTNGDQAPPEFVEEFKRRRRRERWSTFLTPLISLASIVVSIGLLMFFIRTCEQRVPRPAPDAPPTRPQP